MDRKSSEAIRGWGFTPGFLEPGARNSITDVPGVKVGHWTLHDDRHNTGVTVIVPREDVYEHKCTAAAWVLNGYGKSAGIVQIQELGQMETPIALTNTLNVGLVSDALVEYTAQQCRRHGYELRSVNPVVGECNDSGLNTITERVAGYAQVMEALENVAFTAFLPAELPLVDALAVRQDQLKVAYEYPPEFRGVRILLHFLPHGHEE